MTRVLGVDTASALPDRGYAITQDGAIVWFGSAPPPASAGPIDLVAGERPWEGKGKKAKLKGENLITFAMNNGFQLRDAWPWQPERPPVFFAMTVYQWKDLVLRGCAGYPGDVFCRNFQQKYCPGVRANHNQLDAMGIALAASKIPKADWPKMIQKGFCR